MRLLIGKTMLPARTSVSRSACCAQMTIAATLLAGMPNSVYAAATDWVGNAHATARLITAVTATGSDFRIDAGLEIKMAPGWHAYWRTPGDAGFAPAIDWKQSLNVAQAKIAWPAPTRLSIEGLETYVYPDHVLLPVVVTLSDPGHPLVLRAFVDYAACQEICVPYHADLDLALPSGVAAASEEAPLIAAARDKVPRSLELAGMTLLALSAAPMGENDVVMTIRLRTSGPQFRKPDVFIEGLRHGHAGPPASTISEKDHVVDLVVKISENTAAALAAAPLSFTVTIGSESAVEFVATPGEATKANGKSH